VIYKSIADRLRLRLNSSDFEVGSPLPGKKLAEEFGVARMTIRKAIDLLVTWGWWCVGTAPAPTSPAKTCIMKPAI
jgi:DNA-binding GntR family transcriptional regulator